MKAKILLLMLIILPTIHFIGNDAFAQTVSGAASNTGCLNSGTVTAGSTGLGATPQYQLLKLQSGVFIVVAPAAGDATQFTNNNVFTALASGTYSVKGRATSSGTIYASPDITVTDGYTAMGVATATR